MTKFDYCEGILSVLLGSLLVAMLLDTILGFFGLNHHECFLVWAALSIVWVPVCFRIGARA